MRSTLAISLLLLLCAPALAERPHRWEGPEEGPRGRMSEPGGVSLDAAVSQARRETGGRVLSAETLYDRGAPVHRIKVLTPDRRVRILHIPAR